MNHLRDMLRRISASLLCALFLLGGSMPARAEQMPATPTDLEEKAEPFEQTETAEGVRITVTAEPGVFAADAVLSVVKADDAEAARAAEKALGAEAGDTVIILHRMYRISGAEMSGNARITLEKLGLTDLQAQYPDAEISAAVLRIEADKAQKINAEISVSGNRAVFSTDRTGVYDLAVTVRLPEQEEPAEEEQPEDGEQPAEEETVEEQEPAAEEQEPSAEEPKAEPAAETQEPIPEETEPAAEAQGPVPEETEPAAETGEPAAAERPAETLSTASREAQEPAEPEKQAEEEQGVAGAVTPADKVEAFVTRCYWLILGREPEPQGLKHWTDLLKSQQLTAAEVISGFLNGPEFRNKHKPAEDLVEILYRTMLNRASDEGGRRTWIKVITDGASMNKLINGFSTSPEFRGLCESYGIESGSLKEAGAGEPAAYSEKLVAFVTRCYRVALGREPENEGLYFWCDNLARKRLSYREVAEGFVFSAELNSKNLNNEQFVKVLYRLYLDREAEPEGLKFWVNLLNEGKTRREVSEGFASSVEFTQIVMSFNPDSAFEPDYTYILVPGDTGLTVKNGAKVRVQPSPELSAPANLKWSSSDTAIFTVSGNGEIFGVYPGQAVLTISRPDGSVFMKLNVKVQANYRAVLFSESTFAGGIIKRNRGDVRLMKNMLSSVCGPDGGQYMVYSFDDLTANQVYAKVDELLIAPSRDGDVSMFFFASHGDYRSTDPKQAGRLYCKYKKTWILLQELAGRLTRVKGKVIVLLETCGPGAALRDVNYAAPGSNRTAPEQEETDDTAFREAAIHAFTAADPGLRVYRSGVETADSGADQGVMASNLFLTEKFIIMVASGYLEASYSIGTDTSNLFPNKLCKGVGTSGAMPADTECGNGDGRLTVNELFLYVYKTTKYRQTPEVYPKDSDYVLFLRR